MKTITLLSIDDVKAIAALNDMGLISMLDKIGCREAYYSSIKQRKETNMLTEKLSGRILSFCSNNGLKTQI